MITTIAVHGYRSLRDLAVPLAPVTLVTGPNGAGKSSLYRALRLLAATASDGVVASLATEGGLDRVLWAGPEVVSGAMRRGEVPVQGTSRRSKPVSLMLGLATEELGYLIDVGLPTPSQTAFARDPQIKREEIFAGPVLRPSARLVQRKGGTVTVIDDEPRPLGTRLSPRVSMLSELADPDGYPEISWARRLVGSWRFYDSFRTDGAAPARSSCVGTWTPVLADDGHDLPAAVQTILESAWAGPFSSAFEDAFPGSRVQVDAAGSDGRFRLEVHQPGMLRPLGAEELSDGTLRFLLLLTALLSPQPPGLLVLNEPETSLHPHVLPVLARLVTEVAARTQVMIVSHSEELTNPLRDHGDEDTPVVHHHLVKNTGETTIEGRGLLTRTPWEWGRR
ncbi:AAA family ATPase [Tessaracoccus sp. OS52]|uniref:AAA family ATPase n=1 Tax=Tessaracoccus sp. OS52 TaxID=2886691 RepID=UPI001D111BFC|nr:AAA family ATPase [Tessaracoccus sp. OS52]MCC2593895.1 AAA family ATPase [Tessaracoccus sp. OS52]